MQITVKNGFREILAERRISSASALARRMAPFLGKELSVSQITRYMYDPPPRFDLKFIEAACNALGCLPTDLFKISIKCGPDDDLSALGTLSRRVDVVRVAADPAPSARANGTDGPAPSAEQTPAEGPRHTDASIHTGPKVDVFPFGRK